MLKDFDKLLKYDVSGKMSKESYVRYHYPEHYLDILNFCKENELDDLPFKEKIIGFLFVQSVKEMVVKITPNTKIQL